MLFITSNFILLIVVIFLLYRISWVKRNDCSPNTKLGSNNYYKISSRPYLFGVEEYLICNESLYFDEFYLYIISSNGAEKKYNIKDITELNRTYIQVNSYKIWQLKITQGKETTSYNFIHNYNMWNRNFEIFYTRLYSINPMVAMSEWNELDTLP